MGRLKLSHLKTVHPYDGNKSRWWLEYYVWGGVGMGGG